MKAFYNEIEPFAVEWLANLVCAGHITDGTVDDRSILDIRPEDLAGHDRCHFFAGIGLWDYALALAGWPDDAPVWTGSCPCQPFSSAGAQRGFADERHLWPVWFELIRECRPPIIVGEQVGGPAGKSWLDLVFADLEGAGYACGAADLCAAGVGAPHRRQRLYWAAVQRGALADPHGAGLEERPGQRGYHGQELPAAQRGGGAVRPLGNANSTPCGGYAGARDSEEARVSKARDCHGSIESDEFGAPSSVRPLADSYEGGLVVERQARLHDQGARGHDPPRCGEACAVADAETSRNYARDDTGSRGRSGQKELGERSDNGGVLDYANPWSDVEWLPCRDGVYRPTQPGLQPLAHGHTNKMGKLRAYGNAIVPQVAAAFLEALMGTLVP